MEKELSGILHIAQQDSIIKWAYDQGRITDMVLAWDQVSHDFYQLPIEERDKYYTRPGRHSADAEIWNVRESLWINAYLNDQLAVREQIAKYEHDWEDVDDLTQSAFCHAWENLDRYDYRSSFLTWLVTLSINLTKDHIKAITALKRPQIEYEHRLPSPIDGEQTPYDERCDLSVELSEMTALQDPALVAEGDDTVEYAAQDAGVRAILRGRLRGDSNPDIARALGVSEKSVRNRLSATKQKVWDNRAVLSSNSVQARTMDELAEAQVQRFWQRFRAGAARDARLHEQAELVRR